jgi:hypothetical protein
VSKNLLNPTINRVQENATADVNVLPIKRSNNKFKFELRILTRLRSPNLKEQLTAALLIRQQLDVTQKHLLTFPKKNSQTQ